MALRLQRQRLVDRLDQLGLIDYQQREYVGLTEDGDLAGHTFVTSGLGGMSGAQPKALEISGGAGIVAEVDASRIETRHSQGWVSKVTDDLATSVRWMLDAADAGEGGGGAVITAGVPGQLQAGCRT